MQGNNQPPQYPPPPPGPPVRPNLWQRYRAASKTVQIGIGCLAIFFIFGLCSAASRSIAGSAQTPQDTPTAQVIATTPTPEPTIEPTQQATVAPPTKSSQASVPPTQLPAPKPTQPPAPPPTQPPAPTGVNGNPWGYDFNARNGHVITNPPINFCDYFACIASFWNGVGYIEECADTTFSLSGGIQGSCSRHGGNLRPLYAH